MNVRIIECELDQLSRRNYTCSYRIAHLGTCTYYSHLYLYLILILSTLHLNHQTILRTSLPPSRSVALTARGLAGAREREKTHT